jgi:RNA polymerase sigma-70 factor (ECF subfamily)
LLEGLEESRREIFVMVELEQLSAPDVATVLEIPLNTVYSRLRRARSDFELALHRHRVRTERRGNG